MEVSFKIYTKKKNISMSKIRINKLNEDSLLLFTNSRRIELEYNEILNLIQNLQSYINQFNEDKKIKEIRSNQKDSWMI